MPPRVPYADDVPHLAAFARMRWGPTGFVCRHCGNTRAYTVRTRPRVRQCTRCRRILSVTAGTLLHATRLPIAHWVRRGEQFEGDERIPTCTELAATLWIARSTAWHFNQRMFRLAENDARPAGSDARYFFARIKVRRPRPSPPMAAAAPSHVRSLHEDHRRGRISPLHIDLSVHLTDETLWPDRVALTRVEIEERRQSSPNWMQRHDNYGFDRWIHANLELHRHTVSLRWLPRWLHATMAHWRSGLFSPPRWDIAAVRCGRLPLRALDPWALPGTGPTRTPPAAEHSRRPAT